VSLPELIERARRTEVRADLAERRVAELVRWTRPATSRWLPFGAGLAVAAAAAAMIVWLIRTPPPEQSPVSIGDRVAIVSEPGTRYRVATASHEATEIVVDRGAVTARLWPGAQPHELALRGGDVVARATGTIYTLSVDAKGGAKVSVHEGKVDVSRAERHSVVSADGHALTGAAAELRALPAPPPEPPAPAPTPTPTPTPTPITPAPPVDAPAHPVAVDAHVPTANERWREIRKLRAQDQLDAAVSECIALADMKDATWSPIALVEAIRIELGPLAAPERAIELADRMLREWPQHALAAETRALRKQAISLRP